MAENREEEAAREEAAKGAAKEPILAQIIEFITKQLKSPLLWRTLFFLVVGAWVIYANSKGGNRSIWAFLVIPALIVCFLWVFTRTVDSHEGLTAKEKEVREHDKKIRSNLIRFSYVFMFFSIAGAIMPFLISWSVDKKQTERPLSVLIGCSTDTTTAKELHCKDSENSLWIINIAGRAKSFPDSSEIINVDNVLHKKIPLEDKMGQIDSMLSTISISSNKLIQVDNILQDKKISASIKVARLDSVIHPISISNSKIMHVNGGVVVPLYFVILALIGGAVSLTRRVPEYQKQSAPSYVGTAEEPKLDTATLREKLVFQIVQFIAAPFIAIVAYYLIAPSQRAYSVALGFTAGFASETILKMIRAVVQKVNPMGIPVAQTGTISGLVTDSVTKIGIPDANIKVIGPASLENKTDSSGQFVIHDIPIGEQAVEASDSKGNTQIGKVTVHAGKVSKCHISLP